MFANRKVAYKLPPTSLTDRVASQQARRVKALEEQKRRRALRIDSSRQLDQFADLNLGGDESDDDNNDEQSRAGTRRQRQSAPGSVARYVQLLEEQQTTAGIPVTANAAATVTVPEVGVKLDGTGNGRKRGGGAGKKQRSHNRTRGNRSNKPSKWADRCMHAELLEMAPESPKRRGVEPVDVTNGGDDNDDGLPDDLESKWVAVGPVPVGKRCIAVTHQISRIAGFVPNTTLRSRVLGKVLIQSFPSILPPLTVLDCILDVNWRENGILHVLDVIRWKGQDISDCEALFRFWWRDTRLSELIPNAMIPPVLPSSHPKRMGHSYHFPYPVTLVPVPHHTDTTYSSLSTRIIPFARSMRFVNVAVPVPVPGASATLTTERIADESMDTDHLDAHRTATVAVTIVPVQIAPDGLLLYVSEASYEAGTSPLSNWVPILAPVPAGDREEREGGRDKEVLIGPRMSSGEATKSELGPLDVFERHVHQRMERRGFDGMGLQAEARIDVEM